jgi:Na+-driven multidrug efflux pump
MTALFYMLPYSISQATTIMAGQRLGARNYDGAKEIVKLGIGIDFLNGIIVGLLLVTVLRSVSPVKLGLGLRSSICDIGV